jgi:hypothetical protein
VYNKTQHGTNHGRPDRVTKNPIQEFLVLRDNTEKAQHNNGLLAARKKLLAKTGTLVKTFRRGFKSTYGNVQKVDRIAVSTAHIRGGGKVDIKRVIDKDSGDVPVTFGEFSQRAKNKREKT